MEKNLITPLLSAPCSFTGPLPVLLLSIRELKAISSQSKANRAPPFLFLCGETKPGPFPGKGSGVQQALAAEGPASSPPAAPSFSVKPTSCADAVRAQISKEKSHWAGAPVLTPLFVSGKTSLMSEAEGRGPTYTDRTPS